MTFLCSFKSTVLLSVFLFSACGNQTSETDAKKQIAAARADSLEKASVMVGANRTVKYLPLLQGKKIGVVANQTSVIFKRTKNGVRTAKLDSLNSKRRLDSSNRTEDSKDIVEIQKPVAPSHKLHPEAHFTHLVDSLLALQIDIKKVFAPEHGFRGEADAGEKVSDGIDAKTGLPLISLYGKNRKPSAEHLKGLDVVLFDIQDVGTRFYTYIATLQLVMEACAENKIPVIVLDRPNPNGHYIDGPTMEKEHTGFLGMTEIPLVYGMTIGEYAKMINAEGWLEGGKKVELTVIPLENWKHETTYHLPIRPSPNLPNDVSINLYPSLGLFEGTNINAGRGTEFQFQRYGASFLDSTQYNFTYTPKPNFGSKNPKQEGKKCFGKDLSQLPRINEVSLKWLMDAYANTVNKSLFFNTSGFTKHAGTEKLQQQIETGLTEEEIKATWQPNLEAFKKIRKKYLIYPL